MTDRAILEMLRRFTLLACLAAPALAPAALDPTTLPEVGFHPSSIAYWDTPYLADAMQNGAGWIEFAPGQWGDYVQVWNSPQFDANGFPKYLNPGMRLRALTWGLHTDYGNRPATWPVRGTNASGRVVLTWEGNADVRLNGGGTFVTEDSNGAATGSIDNGRRVYVYPPGSGVQYAEVHAIDAADPITAMNVWLSDPASPATQSLEGQVFHPTAMARMADAEWGFIRTMNLTDTNGNPQQDWADRRLPVHAFATGTLNPRAPSGNSIGYRSTGLSWEHCVAMANAADRDLWINVPHLATDDYVRNLARLIRYGSDGVNPYTAPTASPVWAPLNAGHRVFLEFSNEIWSNGAGFPQGDWAQEQADAMGITKPQFNARRYCEVWRLFQEEFGGDERVVRVAAIFAGGEWYSRPFLQEMAAYGPTLTPAVEPDAIAATTYFGNGIQDWALQEARAHAGTGDPWFLTGATFDAGGGNMHDVSIAAADPYWTSEALERHLQATFDEWEYRMLSGDAREGAGPDAVGIGGGFDQWTRDLALTTFPTPKPIVAYEGGPSLYTDGYDWGDVRDDGITTFMEALNRHPRFAEVYRIHLNMAKARGLRTHVMFTDSGPWGKYGQWGHLEFSNQPPRESPKYAFLLDWMAEQEAIHHVDDVTGEAPAFATAHNLPVATWGVPYNAGIMLNAGEAPRTMDVIGARMRAGLSVTSPTSDTLRVSGTPTESGNSYALVRALDADGDPAWRTYTLRTVGGPNTLVEASFEGTNLSQGAAPWSASYVLRSGVAYSGIGHGAGIHPEASDNSYAWSQDMPAAQADSTLALAIADNEYLTFTLTPPDGATFDLAGHEARFTIRRIDYHAPRRYAFFSSVGGFADGDQIGTSSHNGGIEDQEVRLTFPNDAAYDGIAGPVEFRLVGFAGQYGGHDTSIVEMRVDGGVNLPGVASATGWVVTE